MMNHPQTASTNSRNGFNVPINRTATLFLKFVIILIGIGTLTFLLWEPHVEGRNVDATLFQIYFKDPFLAYVYASSVAFFVLLYQALKLLGNIGKDDVFTLSSVRALRTIKYCAAILVLSILGAEVFIVISQGGKDDIAGGVAVGLFALCIFVVSGITAAMFERLLQKAVDMKSENDLTI